jgi:hypothetical protein
MRQIEVGGERTDGTSEVLVITLRNDWPDEAELRSKEPLPTVPIADLSVATPETLYYDYSRDGGGPFRSSFSAGLGRIAVRPHLELPASRSILLAARQRPTLEEMASRFTTMQDMLGAKSIVGALSELQPGLQSLTIGLRALDGGSAQLQLRVHVEGLSTPLPLQSLGEGVGRLTEMLLAIASLPNGVLFVDEVENGLYYRNLETAWRAIDDVSRKANVQIFATTHSAECVQAAVRALSGDSAEEFRLFRLEPGHDEIRVVKYDHDTAAAALEFDLEFR